MAQTATGAVKSVSSLVECGKANSACGLGLVIRQSFRQQAGARDMHTEGNLACAHESVDKCPQVDRTTAMRSVRF